MDFKVPDHPAVIPAYAGIQNLLNIIKEWIPARTMPE
jgi:hypothetical protein